jgi:hypothetical protein
MKYRKKPVVVEAVAFDGTAQGCDTVIRFTGEDSGVSYYEIGGVRIYDVFIETREGRMCARPGDYVIKGVKGEFYPCKPDIFEATYEPAYEDGSLCDTCGGAYGLTPRCPGCAND